MAAFPADHAGFVISPSYPRIGFSRLWSFWQDAGRIFHCRLCRRCHCLYRKNFTEPVDLLGHSLGAHVSLVIANAIPKHIRSVILEDLPVWTADGRLQGRPFQPIFAAWRDILGQGKNFGEFYHLLGESE